MAVKEAVKEVVNNMHLITKFGGSCYIPLTRYLKQAGIPNPKHKDPLYINVINGMIIIKEKEFTTDQIEALRKI